MAGQSGSPACPPRRRPNGSRRTDANIAPHGAHSRSPRPSPPAQPRATPSSLRAQRSNPAPDQDALDCFATLAMTDRMLSACASVTEEPPLAHLRDQRTPPLPAEQLFVGVADMPSPRHRMTPVAPKQTYPLKTRAAGHRVPAHPHSPPAQPRATPSSLRAQRSNPAPDQDALDCFATLAMTDRMLSACTPSPKRRPWLTSGTSGPPPLPAEQLFVGVADMPSPRHRMTPAAPTRTYPLKTRTAGHRAPAHPHSPAQHLRHCERSEAIQGRIRTP